ncbi:type II/IV secretion system protein [bacterium]|nr:type II/IV secretion system protein [bacterium]
MSSISASHDARQSLSELAPKDGASVPDAVARLLQAAQTAQASDLHLLPTRKGLELSWRLDGVLSSIGVWPAELAPNVISRLKVLADLLTYRTDLPQEGRLRQAPGQVEMRLSTFPTLYGEKGVVRLFVGTGSFDTFDDLGLADDQLPLLRRALEETTGCLIFAGPAGSGKTTTAYTCLREMQQLHAGRKSLVTLEDPIEAELPGITQSAVNRPAEFTYSLGLRSLMRQDPDVILVGEIRDRETAETVFQASLTGHLVLSTFHAGSAAQAVTRLRDLGVEPFLLRSGLRGIQCQRLMRKKCPSCTTGCESCWSTGYRGRVLIAEWLQPESLPTSLEELQIIPADSLQIRALAAGMKRLSERAKELIAQGQTTLAEAIRVLGHEALTPDAPAIP